MLLSCTATQLNAYAMSRKKFFATLGAVAVLPPPVPVKALEETAPKEQSLPTMPAPSAPTKPSEAKGNGVSTRSTPSENSGKTDSSPKTAETVPVVKLKGTEEKLIQKFANDIVKNNKGTTNISVNGQPVEVKVVQHNSGRVLELHLTDPKDTIIAIALDSNRASKTSKIAKSKEERQKAKSISKDKVPVVRETKLSNFTNFARFLQTPIDPERLRVAGQNNRPMTPGDVFVATTISVFLGYVVKTVGDTQRRNNSPQGLEERRRQITAQRQAWEAENEAAVAEVKRILAQKNNLESYRGTYGEEAARAERAMLQAQKRARVAQERRDEARREESQLVMAQQQLLQEERARLVERARQEQQELQRAENVRLAEQARRAEELRRVEQGRRAQIQGGPEDIRQYPSANTYQQERSYYQRPSDYYQEQQSSPPRQIPVYRPETVPPETVATDDNDDRRYQPLMERRDRNGNFYIQ